MPFLAIDLVVRWFCYHYHSFMFIAVLRCILSYFALSTVDGLALRIFLFEGSNFLLSSFREGMNISHSSHISC